MASTDPATDALEALGDVRPQAFGSGHHSRIVDPLVEPLWSGIRVLVAVDGDRAVAHDEGGEQVDERPEILDALVGAVRDARVILDGLLTREAVKDGTGLLPEAADVPSAGQFITHAMVGRRRNRAQELAEESRHLLESMTFDPDEPVAFVALDLLWLDGEWLTDVPLLERKRLLESVLDETDIVRRGIYVRLPIDTWVGSWRTIGFRGIAFKAPNSRYRPGERNDDWITTRMPQR
jgi:hypothetical protein